MNEFLSSYYERAEIIVEAGSIDATPNEDQSDKIILSIVNIERETAMGISAPYRNTKNNTFQQTSPPWYLNIYIMVAAVFSSKRYLESIQILSDSISFLQQNSILKLPDHRGHHHRIRHRSGEPAGRGPKPEPHPPAGGRPALRRIAGRHHRGTGGGAHAGAGRGRPDHLRPHCGLRHKAARKRNRI